MSEGLPGTTSSSSNSLPLGVGLSWASPSACSAIQQLKDHSQVSPSPRASVYHSVHQESNRGASPCLNQDCIQLCASDRALECTLCTQEGTAKGGVVRIFPGDLLTLKSQHSGASTARVSPHVSPKAGPRELQSLDIRKRTQQPRHGQGGGYLWLPSQMHLLF